MKENSTRPLLLLYAYNECNLSEGDEAQRMIDGDPVIAQEYKELHENIGNLDTFIQGPSEETLRKVLAFAAGK